MTRRGENRDSVWTPAPGTPDQCSIKKIDLVVSQWPGEDGKSSLRLKKKPLHAEQDNIGRVPWLAFSGGQRVSFTYMLAIPLRRQKRASSLLILSSKASFNFMHHPFFLKQKIIYLFIFFPRQDSGIMLNWGFFNFRNWLLGVNFSLLSLGEHPWAGEISLLNSKNKMNSLLK